MSPSHAKIFSTRPAEREATCTSSTSIVPETALFRRLQPVRKAIAQMAMANEERMRSCATLCAGNGRKGNGWLLENTTGPKAWDQVGHKGGRAKRPRKLPEIASAPSGRRLLRGQGD